MRWHLTPRPTRTRARSPCFAYFDVRAPVGVNVRQLIDIIRMANTQLHGFSEQAAVFWNALSADVRAKILTNVYCGHCRGETSILNVTGAVKGGDLVLKGSCAKCGQEVARLVEGPGS